MLDGMSDSIQRSRIENLQSREVDRQSPTGLIFCIWCYATYSQKNHACGSNENIVHITELVADNKLRDDDADDDEVQCNLTTASSSGRTGGKASSSQEL